VSLGHVDEPSFGASFCARRRGAEHRFRPRMHDSVAILDALSRPRGVLYGLPSVSGGRPKAASAVVSPNHVSAHIWDPLSVTTSSPYGRGMCLNALTFAPPVFPTGYRRASDPGPATRTRKT
jgi:hypothetical protein